MKKTVFVVMALFLIAFVGEFAAAEETKQHRFVYQCSVCDGTAHWTSHVPSSMMGCYKCTDENREHSMRYIGEEDCGGTLLPTGLTLYVDETDRPNATVTLEEYRVNPSNQYKGQITIVPGSGGHINIIDDGVWTFGVIEPDAKWEEHWVNPPELDTEFNTLRARITKLEAELRRTAALVYTIHGGGEWKEPQRFVIVDEAGNEVGMSSSFPSRYISTCEMSVSALFEQRIDECLANVTIEEEKE